MTCVYTVDPGLGMRAVHPGIQQRLVNLGLTGHSPIPEASTPPQHHLSNVPVEAMFQLRAPYATA
ncbi:MAG: hypothetical protein QNJ46_29515 [Leptolyngbyaceae cyanobacterium MO_188.B28]|nr:hypothetical protein [Leptolyngbyaceae cyanobacterium MO_188.B28]